MTPNETTTPTVDETSTISEEKKPSLFREVVTFILLTLVIVLPIRLYIAQPYIVSGTSMDPTFEAGDYLIVDQLTYRFTQPTRGDVVIFRFPLEPSKFFIKRLIGMPGETITLDGDIVRITPRDGSEPFVLREEYLTFIGFDDLTLELADDEYFVMGDNREASLDSRTWGAVPRDHLIGRAFVRIFPIGQAALLPGTTQYTEEEGS